jgi:hypothetical protein
MSNKTLDKIRQIKDEVKELHPLLEKLLPKMPRFSSLEYNQGNREMGADFVVARKDDTFEKFDYVGIVAKVGDIKQNFTEVERQIDECTIPRYFNNGRDKIILDEVWVVFTGTVTNNAQEKIHEKFKGRKIVFVDGKQLAKLVEDLLPAFWDLVTIEIGEYLTNLGQRYLELDRSVNLVHVGNERFYIEQDVFSYPREEYRLKLKRLSKPARKLNIFETIKREKITLIEGFMGSGKSKLLREIVLHFSDPHNFSDSNIIPIPITFRELNDQFNGDVQKLIDSVVTPKFKAEIDENIKILLVIDGIDEKKLTNEEQIENLKRICEFVHAEPSLKAVFASRPLEALDKSSELDKLIYSCQLRSLSFSKTIEFLQKVCSKLNIKDKLLKELKKSILFNDLPRSPISVILLANLLNEDPKDLPSSLTELYTKYLELSLGRWDITKGLQSQKQYEALNNIMMNMARHVLEADTPFIGISEAKGMFASYLKTRNTGINPDELFNTLVDRTEIMLVNESNQTIGFKHRTFAEYFYANAAFRDKNMLISQRAFQQYWMDSYFFYLGIQKDSPEVVKEIINLVPQNDGEEILKIINMPNFLMAAYLTPYEVISDGVTTAVVEAAQLYEKLISGKTDRILARLPRMHLLWLFQALIRETYSYEFLIKALEESALNIAAREDLSDTTKIYALFFLNVAYIESGGGKTFDFLLKDYAKGLPLDVMLAYDHESKNMKKKSDLMKRTDKRIKRLLGGNRQLTREVHKLYENPLGTISKQVDKVRKIK